MLTDDQAVSVSENVLVENCTIPLQNSGKNLSYVQIAPVVDLEILQLANSTYIPTYLSRTNPQRIQKLSSTLHTRLQP